MARKIGAQMLKAKTMRAFIESMWISTYVFPLRWMQSKLFKSYGSLKKIYNHCITDYFKTKRFKTF